MDKDITHLYEFGDNEGELVKWDLPCADPDLFDPQGKETLFDKIVAVFLLIVACVMFGFMVL